MLRKELLKKFTIEDVKKYFETIVQQLTRADLNEKFDYRTKIFREK